MRYGAYDEQKNMLHEISKLDFAVIDMTLYLDTHPYDLDAMEQWNRYQNRKRQLEREYNMKYPPLQLNDIDGTGKEWTWALQEPPWRRGY